MCLCVLESTAVLLVVRIYICTWYTEVLVLHDKLGMQLICSCRSYLHVHVYSMSKYLALYVVERSFIASLAVSVVRIMYVQGWEGSDTIENIHDWITWKQYL